MTAAPCTTSARLPGAPGAPAEAPRTLSLRHNFSWTLAGNAVSAASQLGILVALAKLLPSTAVGAYALAAAVATPVFVFFSLKLRSVQSSDVRGDHAFADYLGLRAVTTALALLVVAGVCVAGGYGGQALGAVALVALARAADAVTDVLHGVFQVHERMDLSAKAMLVKGPLSLAALATAVYFTRSLLWGLAAMTAALVLVLLAYEAPQARRTLAARAAPAPGPAAAARVPSRWRRLRPLALLALPLGLTLGLNALWVNVPRYFLAWSLGEREVGVFAALASPLMAGGLIVTALAQSAAPRLARYHAEGRRGAFNRLVLRLAALGGLVGVLGVAAAFLVGEPFLRVVYTEEYARHAGLLPWLCAGAGLSFAYVFCGSALTAMRQFRVQLPIHVASLAVMVALCAALVPRGGLRGAAVAMFLAYAAEGALYTLTMLFRRARAAATAAATEGG